MNVVIVLISKGLPSNLLSPNFFERDGSNADGRTVIEPLHRRNVQNL